MIVDTHNKENPESVSNVSDSGESDATSSIAYELDENNREQQKHVNKIDHKHTSDQTEKKMDINCLSDQRKDRTSEPCQQTTLVEKNKQDEIVKPCIKDEVKVLCHTNNSEYLSKYSPQREPQKYSPQKETEKQVAKITPFRSKNGKFFVAFHINTNVC